MSYSTSQFGMGKAYWLCDECNRLNPEPTCLTPDCSKYLQELDMDKSRLNVNKKR